MAGLIPFHRNRHNIGYPFRTMLDDFFGDGWMTEGGPAGMFRLDVRESDADYTVYAELPGVRREEIALETADGCLTITVSRDEDKQDERSGYVHRERRTASARRSVYLAGAANEGATAELKDGVLTVTIPKEAGTERRRQIQIS